METSKFFNTSQDEITEQQANEQELFIKHIYNNGILKQRHLYFDQNFETVDYLRDSTEDENVLLNSLIIQYPSLDQFRIEYIEPFSGRYSIEYVNIYNKNKVLCMKHKSLLKDGLPICIYILDPITFEMSDKKSIYKCLYIINNEGKEKLKFRASYNEDGSLMDIVLHLNPDNPGDDNDDNELVFDESNLSSLKDYTDLTDEEVEYYKNADFYPTYL